MRIESARGILASVVVGLVVLMIVSGIPGLSAAWTPPAGTRAGDLILKVGGQDEMKIRNPLPAISNDVWTSDVLFRVYDTVLQGDPKTSQPLAYIAKGVDFNEDGVFEPTTEYNVWGETPGTSSPLAITVYYDFNGVRWHDGKQMTVWDLFFSYHVNAMNPRFNTGLRVLYCDSAPTTTYDSCSRQLGIRLANKNWQGESGMPGDPNLRAAVRYTLNQKFALFYTSTLGPVLFPMHEWSRAYGDRHPDFGCAVWIPASEATLRNLPDCQTANAALYGQGIRTTDTVPNSTPYAYPSAEGWAMTDADVIGNGPFKFVSWLPGSEAKVIRNEDMYTGVDTATNTHYDDRLAAILQKPIIDGIRYIVKKNTQVGVLALENGDIDFYHWNVPAEFVPELLQHPEIAVGANAEPGFFYTAYNLRGKPWGYTNQDPSKDDGFVLRQAISHLIDKKSIVQNLLQNFGVIGYGVISPSNTFWYNDTIPKPDFDLSGAMTILNSAEAQRVGIGPKPSGVIDARCDSSHSSDCRVLPRIGNQPFNILTPTADYDPVRNTAGQMIAASMRQVGLNAVSQPTAFGTIVSLINAHQFDMFILGWRIGGTDPDYLFDFFDSSNAPSGQNYPGFNNATFDQAIGASRAELDRNKRQALIFKAQGIVAEARPYDVLYYRTNIEAYRQDRFTGWTVSSGSIWNYWSLQKINAPSGASLRLVISVPNNGAANSSIPMSATVYDNTGQAVSGASVNWSAATGTFTAGSTTNTALTLTTDATGRVSLRYNAPSVAATTAALLTITARATGFADVSKTQPINVFPVGQPFLSIALDFPTGNSATAGATIPMTVAVRDQNQALVTDASVLIAIQPPGQVTPSPASGSSGNVTRVSLQASASINQVSAFNVTVSATKGSLSTTTSQEFTVNPSAAPWPRCPDGTLAPDRDPAKCRTVSTPGLDVLPVLGGIAIAAIVVGVLAERKRRS